MNDSIRKKIDRLDDDTVVYIHQTPANEWGRGEGNENGGNSPGGYRGNRALAGQSSLGEILMDLMDLMDDEQSEVMIAVFTGQGRKGREHARESRLAALAPRDPMTPHSRVRGVFHVWSIRCSLPWYRPELDPLALGHVLSARKVEHPN